MTNYPAMIATANYTEPVPRRIRAFLSGVRSAYQPLITLTSQGPEPVKGPKPILADPDGNEFCVLQPPAG